ncbi:hypothetical protein [Halorussus halophilus]|uniref:hypothetical protein n=1 Tax=Halorussus halophilus TaxID=2650975 RepID=UPI00178870A1|nr:hypothetical protein [Halorussus halophilus]
MSTDGLESRRSKMLRAFLVFLATVVFLYSILIATQPLLGVFFVVFLFLAYLAWQFLGIAKRFVVALERIADSMEQGDDSVGSRVGSEEVEREREF